MTNVSQALEEQCAAPALAHTPDGAPHAGDGTAPLITTANLTKRYGSRTAVDDLSLTVRRSEIYGFLGPRRSPSLWC